MSVKVTYVAMLVDNLRLHGITSAVINLSDALVDAGVHVDILSGGEIAESLQGEISNEVKIVKLPDRKKETIPYMRALRNLVKKRGYDCVHIHCNSATVLLELFALYGVRCSTALHCHNVTCNHPAFHRLFRGIATAACDFRFACSNEAGEWLFGCKPFKLVPNCFDTRRYAFDKEKRNSCRLKLGIKPEQIVVGHIGRFNQQKNQYFLIKVFCEIAKRHENVLLLMVGDGPSKSDVLKTVPNHLASRAIFLGHTNQVEELYCAMDCFVFPSRFESLGLSAVEAQLNGLPCFASDQVPKEACVSDAFYQIPLSSSAEEWAAVIESGFLRNYHSTDTVLRDREGIAFERYGLERLKSLALTLYAT